MDLLKYLLIGECVLLSFYLAWYLFFRRNLDFQWSRSWLLLGLFGTMALPLLNGYFQESQIAVSIALPSIEIGEQALFPTNSHTATNWGIWEVLSVIYFLGLTIAFSRFIWSVTTLLSYFKYSSSTGDGLRVLDPEMGQEAFSFWNTVFIPHEISVTDRETVIKHEQIHIAQKHSLDLIITELWKCMHWFSPMNLVYPKAVRDTHEYIVDDKMTNGVIDRDSYAESIIRAHQSKLQISLMHSFSNKSSIKNRLKMMYKRKNTNVKYLRLLALPFLAIALLAACSKLDQKDVVIEERDVVEGEEVLRTAELMPEFPGGQETFIDYLISNITYPESEKEEGLEGNVRISFTIDKSGQVTDTKVVKSLGKKFDNNALEVIKNMPNWSPGEQNGKKVAVQMTLPISYKL